MATIKEWVETETAGAPVEAVVIGTHYQDHWLEDDELPFSNAPTNVVLTWEQAVPFLSYEFYPGFGGADCHPVTAWTATKVIFVSEYDGATSIASVPRNPVAHMPDFH